MDLISIVANGSFWEEHLCSRTT